MIAGLKPYPVMKDSGIPWLEEVPTHWQVLPLSAVATPKSITGQQHRELLSVYLNRGVIRFSEVEEKRTNVTSEDLSKYQVVDPGDFVLNNQQAWRGSVGVSRLSGIVSPAYIVLSLNAKLHTDFANHLFRDQSMVTQYLICSRGVGSIQRNLYWPHLKRVVFPLPPLAEQIAIVRFLDHADRRIKRYILAKQKLIVLLEEQKQAIIQQAVTGKIDVRTGQPYPAYKPSGVEWLKDVPAHWEMQRLKTLCAMKSGDSISSTSIEPTGEFPVYGGNGLRGYASNYTHDGNFALIGRQGALCGNVRIARGKFWASEHSVVATIRSDYVLEWLCAVLSVMNLNQYSIAAAQPGLSIERVLNLWLAIPSPEEQAIIATSVNQQTVSIDTSIHLYNRQVMFLREYRTRLIADVVTGNLDVRKAAAALPEVDFLTAEDILNDNFDTTEYSDLGRLDTTLEEAEV